MNVANTMRYPSSQSCIDGIALQSFVTISLHVKGIVDTAENRNIHFMKVTTEYFLSKGLNIPKYNEKLNPLNIIMISPDIWVLSAPDLIDTLLNIRISIPTRLTKTPPTFFNVIGSFIATAAMNIVYIGDKAARREQSIGVTFGNATKKVIWHMKNPRNAAANILGISLMSTFSLGKNNDNNQNRLPAPIARKVNIAKGEIRCPPVRSLQRIILKPNIAYAAKQAACPANVDLSFIIRYVTANVRIILKERHRN